MKLHFRKCVESYSPACIREQQERSRPLSNNTRSNRTENATFNSVFFGTSRRHASQDRACIHLETFLSAQRWQFDAVMGVTPGARREGNRPTYRVWPT